MSHAIFGLPHGDPLNSYTDREAKEERYQDAKAERERLGEAGVGEESTWQDQTKGQTSEQSILNPTANG